ncbi:MAG: helicase, partial [Anaerolineae bacterium]|nr:helicase [Anaerolineae bacterium]
AGALAGLILELGQRRLDAATGFFEPGAWRLLHEAFPHLERFRLLLGRAPEIAARGEDTLDLRQLYRRHFQGDLEALPYDATYAALADSLLAFLRRPTVEVRLYPSFLHAKAYIFSDVAVVGSSNLTEAGLTRKAELNLVRKEQAVAAALREEWFERFWAEAEEYKDELIAALEQSKFGSAAHTPFEVFIKALYEYFKDRLLVTAPEAGVGVDLASFQQEGLREAIRLLDRHRGVLIADAVGLGKTYIGMAILEHYLLRRRRHGHIPRGLVVCPAQLRDTVWAPRLDEFGIKATLCSMEEMGRHEFNWRAFRSYDLVLVDEAHNFRNPGTRRYENLNRLICAGRREKYVVLMTATPINNSIWDLYHQVMLMARGSESYYRDYGISNLRGFFKRVAEGSAELFDLLEQTAVRRSRYDIKKRQEGGEPIILPGKGEVRFPRRELRTIHYNLEQTYRGLYEEIAGQIDRLSLVSYNLEQFRIEADEEVVERNNALIGIIKTTFLKRLESSLRAFEVSVQRQARFQQRFYTLLQQGRLLDSPTHRRIIALEEADEPPEAIDELIASLAEVEASGYDLEAIGEQVAGDLRILDDLLEWIAIIRESAGGEAGEDAKLAAVKAELAGPLKGQKVLLFTYYEDTARYLYDALRQDEAWLARAGRPTIGMISGRSNVHEREELIKRFAPVANTPDTDEGLEERRRLQETELQLLICTDVLSEGQNLQDAGVVLNYDLHWNPVRMIQRAGRIDRLGLPPDRDAVHIYNCFPEEGLEKLLGLVQRLQERIFTIDRTVGLDGSVLGEAIHPRSLEELKRIKAGERQALEELEQAAELVSTDEMKFPLLHYLQMVGEEKVREIPLGIHSGKAGPIAGTFFAFRAGDRHFWRFFPTAGGEPITDKRQIFRLINCPPDGPRVVPEHSIFELLNRATTEVFQEIRALRAGRKLRPRMTGLNKEFYDALNQPQLFESAPAELRHRVNHVLQTVPLVPFQRDPALRTIRDAFRETHDVAALAEQLDLFFAENGLSAEVSEARMLDEIRQEDLQLVCYEILVPKG